MSHGVHDVAKNLAQCCAMRSARLLAIPARAGCSVSQLGCRSLRLHPRGRAGVARSMCSYPHGMESLSPGTTMADAIKRLGNKFEETALVNGESAFVKPKSLFYELDGKMRRWDAIQSHGSVGIVLYHTQRRAFLLVRQFRPAVYACALREAARAGAARPDLSKGFTFELCAGILDKDKTKQQTASEEIEEETGYLVPAAGIQFINSHISSSGTSGARHYMFYAEVDESKRSRPGGGLADHGELIEVLSLPLDHAVDFLMDEEHSKSPGMMFGILWAHNAITNGKLGNGSGSSLETDDLFLRSVLPS